MNAWYVGLVAYLFCAAYVNVVYFRFKNETDESWIRRYDSRSRKIAAYLIVIAGWAGPIAVLGACRNVPDMPILPFVGCVAGWFGTAWTAYRLGYQSGNGDEYE